MLEWTTRPSLDGATLRAPVEELRDAVAEMLRKAATRGGWVTVRLTAPGRLKTSAENRLFHSLVGHLAMYRGCSPRLMKRYVKVRGCAHGYPYDKLDASGKVVVEPKSVAEATTTELAILIDTCYEVASEWNVQLNQEVQDGE